MEKVFDKVALFQASSVECLFQAKKCTSSVSWHQIRSRWEESFTKFGGSLTKSFFFKEAENDICRLFLLIEFTFKTSVVRIWSQVNVHPVSGTFKDYSDGDSFKVAFFPIQLKESKAHPAFLFLLCTCGSADLLEHHELRYESSTRTLYKELSSSIFQSCQSVIGNTCPDLHFVQYIKA